MSKHSDQIDINPMCWISTRLCFWVRTLDWSLPNLRLMGNGSHTFSVAEQKRSPGAFPLLLLREKECAVIVLLTEWYRNHHGHDN